ncbi:MAG: ComEC family competence protein [bacterium]|nr:ComEC family competence protein [bacterium]
MYRWSPFPFVRIVLLLATGILFSLHSKSNITVLLAIFMGLLIVHLIISYRNMFASYSFNGIVPLILIFILGLMRTEIQKPEFDKWHLLNHEISGSDYMVKLNSYPLEKDTYYMFNSQLLGAMENDSIYSVTGSISLYIRKDSLLSHLPKYGDVLKISKKPFLIAAPKNPHEFNYKEYMSFQGVHHQVFVSNSDFEVFKNNPSNIFLSWSYKLRSHFKLQIEKYVADPNSRAIAFALLLGIKDDLNTDLKRAYSSAGAMHVLAVSGLHVGIIYMLISYMFSFLKSFKGGKYWLLLINLFFLWGYAFVTGLSPSVLRAVVMFSVILIGKSSNRYSNIYNSLAISALIILIYDPYMILKVGFQLSYLAVLGIVYLQPKLYQLLTVKNFILDKAWSITCVSIAAQLATFPLGLYYFHQFPTYFLVSNLIVIPAAFIILLEGIFLIVLSPISDFIGSFFGTILDYSIQLLNMVVIYINNLSYSLIDWVNIDFKQTVLIYLFILLVLLMLHFRKGYYLKLIYLTVVIFFIDLGIRWSKSNDREQIVFYELKDNAAIDFIQGRDATIYMVDLDDDLELVQFQVGPNRLANGLPPVSSTSMNLLNQKLADGAEIISWKGKRLLILDSSFDYLSYEGSIQCDYLIISNDFKVDLAHLSKLIYFEELIIDSTNSYRVGNRIKSQADNLGFDSHFIKKDGAYVVEL